LSADGTANLQSEKQKNHLKFQENHMKSHTEINFYRVGMCTKLQIFLQSNPKNQFNEYHQTLIVVYFAHTATLAQSNSRNIPIEASTS